MSIGTGGGAPQRAHWWAFPRILPPEFCAAQLAAMRERTELAPGKIQARKRLDASVRRSLTGAVDPARHEICGRVRDLVFEANRDAGWLALLSDKVEWKLTHYGATDKGFYVPHVDVMHGADTGRDRKLSCVVQLSERARRLRGRRVLAAARRAGRPGAHRAARHRDRVPELRRARRQARHVGGALEPRGVVLGAELALAARRLSGRARSGDL